MTHSGNSCRHDEAMWYILDDESDTKVLKCKACGMIISQDDNQADDDYILRLPC
jgi:DNA-directed RNA polymerase subunit M/transcription elongation factor TFIIS